MMQAAALPSVELSRFRWRDLGLWAGAAALVLGAHVAVAYAVQNFSMIDKADGGPPPAQMIEMAPQIYYITDHYKGYPAILARPGKMTKKEARGRLERAWRTQAPKTFVKNFDAA